MPTPPPQAQGRNDVPLQELPPNQQYGYQPVQQYSPHPSPNPYGHGHGGFNPQNQGGYYEVLGQATFPQYDVPQAGQQNQNLNHGIYEMGDGRGNRF